MDRLLLCFSALVIGLLGFILDILFCPPAGAAAQPRLVAWVWVSVCVCARARVYGVRACMHGCVRARACVCTCACARAVFVSRACCVHARFSCASCTPHHRTSKASNRSPISLPSFAPGGSHCQVRKGSGTGRHGRRSEADRVCPSRPIDRGRLEVEGWGWAGLPDVFHQNPSRQGHRLRPNRRV